MALGLYTDESPGLKVDPVVVLVLSLVFIFSVVALHSMFALLRLASHPTLPSPLPHTDSAQSSQRSRASSRARLMAEDGRDAGERAL